MTILKGKDGVTHINVFSRGETELGRMMSNFAHMPMVLQDGGSFESLEGYWYWLGNKREEMRGLYGYLAKKRGREAPMINVLPEDIFQMKIGVAMRAKVEQHSKLKQALKESTLPFAHYYVFSGVRKDAGFTWITGEWEKIRQEIKT